MKTVRMTKLQEKKWQMLLQWQVWRLQMHFLEFVIQWLPIVAAAQLSKENEQEKDFLLSWIDIIDFQ